MKRILLTLIDGYRRWISPLHPPCCRYIPTCSTYAKEAITRFGALRGGVLAAWRILRCNPFSRGGYDPVPEEFRLFSRHRAPGAGDGRMDEQKSENTTENEQN